MKSFELADLLLQLASDGLIAILLRFGQICAVGLQPFFDGCHGGVARSLLQKWVDRMPVDSTLTTPIWGG